MGSKHYFQLIFGYLTMTDDPQVLKTAEKMIARYGDDACRQVEERIVELSQSGAGYSDACETWNQVRAAITTLLETSPKTIKN